MKRKWLAALMALLMFAAMSCGAKDDPVAVLSSTKNADQARAWTQEVWDAATEEQQLEALALVIAQVLPDVDAQASAAASLEYFGKAFEYSQAGETLGNLMDASRTEEVDTAA